MYKSVALHINGHELCIMHVMTFTLKPKFSIQCAYIHETIVMMTLRLIKFLFLLLDSAADWQGSASLSALLCSSLRGGSVCDDL